MKKFSNKKINILAAILLIIFVAIFSFGDLFETKSASAAWYSSGGTWNYRKQITVDPEKVSGSSNLTDFPMLFKVTDADLKHTSHGGKMGKTDGTDMLFTSSDGSTKLSHEIEYYASTTGEMVAWVKVPTLYTAQETIIYVYFGNSGASDQQNKTAVWDSNYKGVWHLPNGTTLSATDSTSLNSSTNNGVTANSAKIDGGGLFNGSSSYVEASTSPIVAGTNSFTISAWIRTTSSNTTFGKSIYAERAASGQDIVKLDSTDLGSPNGVFITYRNSAGTLTQLRGPAIINDGQLHYVVGTLSGGTLNVYVNGVLDATGARGGNDTLTDVGKRAWIGGDYQDPNAYFNGTIDEVRVSTSARSADWIATEYNNQSLPTSFYSYGAVGVENRSAAGVKTKGVAPAPSSAIKVRGGVKFR